MAQIMRKVDAELDLHALPDIAKARVLVLSDERTGGANRSIGLAEMLGIKDPEVVTLKPQYSHKLMRMLPVGMLYPQFGQLMRDVKDYDV